MIRRYLPQSTEELIHWYERYVSPLSLLFGFAVDAVAVSALNLTLYSYVLAGHLVFASLGILFLHAAEGGRVRARALVSVVPFVPVAIQFSFGALLSGFVILYSRSAAFSLSWVFVIFLATLLLANERFRRFYGSFPTQVGVLYFALFSFCIIVVPVVLSRVGDGVFIMSGLASLACIVGFLALARVVLTHIKPEVYRTCGYIIAALFFTIHALYFANAIPPLPLALRDAGVFHTVVRESAGYRVTFEEPRWYEKFRRYTRVFHRAPGESVYVYTAVFAPGGITTGIVHEWEWYDEKKDAWVERGTFQFPISGGREGGYRGYSLKSDVDEGAWRVNVQTSYGQLVGRVAFRVENSDVVPLLSEDVR